jgi:FAD/FMN-containing dehydrogenase
MLEPLLPIGPSPRRDDVIVPQVLDAHNMDWLRKYRGNSQLVLKPKTVGEVSAALKYCHDQR